MKKQNLLQALLLLPLMLLVFGQPATACLIIDPHPIIIWPPPQPPPPAPPELRQLETKSHVAEIAIDDQAATVSLEAVFHNPNGFRIEGTYFFPLPADVAVSTFSMIVDGKEMKAELLDADKARQVYEDIVRRLKDPGLLEFAGMQMLKLRVFPIPANGDVTVKLSYRHLVRKDSGICRFMYPLASAMPADKKGIGKFSLRVTLNSKIALKNIYSPTHAIDKTMKDDHHAVIGLEGHDVLPDRDFLLCWSAAEDEIGATLFTHKPAGEDGYFLLLLSPQVEAPETEAAAKDVVFVLDKSGSMQENGKLDQARAALRFCLSKLRDRDRFNLIAFSTSVTAFKEGLLPATPENREAALAFLDKLDAAGGTAIDEALDTGFKAMESAKNLPLLLFLTDGLPTVGEANIDTILDNAAKRNKAKARIFVFGVGYDVNTRLLDRLAEDGRGVREYVKPKEDIELAVSNLYTKIASPVLADLTLDADGIRLEEVFPKTPPDLFRGSQIALLGRYTGHGAKNLRLTGHVGGETKKFTYTLAWSDRPDADFLPPLWAMRKVGYLLDQIRLHGSSPELVEEVTKLGKRYGIVTPYTSFLVVDENQLAGGPGGGIPRPLPEPLRSEARQLLKDAAKSVAMDYAAAPASGAGAQSMSEATARYSGGGFAQSPSMATVAGSGTGAMGGGGFGGVIQDNLRTLGGSEEAASAITQAAIRHIGSKTFMLENGVWTDSEFQSGGGAKITEIEFLSPAYFELLQKHPGFGRYLALGDEVVICAGGQVYKIVKKG